MASFEQPAAGGPRNTAAPNSVSQAAPPAPEYRDRSGVLLLAFGIVQIVVGGLILLLIPLMLLGTLLSRRVSGGMPWGGRTRFPWFPTLSRQW